MTHPDTTIPAIEQTIDAASKAFSVYKNCSYQSRYALLRSIADELKNDSEALVAAAMRETHLTEARLKNELGRTLFQLESYGAAAVEGRWLDATIETRPNAAGASVNLRKTLIPLGPVVVFGASNFPFAYSTAGGDTASALAAGCTVIVKAHPAHPDTSTIAAAAIARAIKKQQLPAGVFSHVLGASFSVGEFLVKHPKVKAVGFTGSLRGGKQLFDWAQQRECPIPVFAEMGSVNPVFLLPDQLSLQASSLAEQVAVSFTLGAGQFCTKPGLLIALRSEALSVFEQTLSEQVKNMIPVSLLHTGIADAFTQHRTNALRTAAVSVLAISTQTAAPLQGQPTVATINAENWLRQQHLHQEIFGPYTLLITCRDQQELLEVAAALEGQLTTTIMGSQEDLQQYRSLIDLVKEKCGRLILNGVPTGVEVCKAMQHGGPFPATTDARFGAVGEDALKRFARPICYQNWSNDWLPAELQDENPLRIYRTVNGQSQR
ncbi:MAG: aldehyde dehydrogenase (NADP(+)) [Sphingomonadales bacterium]